MQKHISIGVPQGTNGMRDPYPTEPKLPTLDQLMHIEAEAYSNGHPSVLFLAAPLPSKRKPSVKRKVFASGLRWVLAMR